MEPISKEQETYIAGILKQLDAAQLEISQLKEVIKHDCDKIGAQYEAEISRLRKSLDDIDEIAFNNGYHSITAITAKALNLNSSKPTGGDDE